MHALPNSLVVNCNLLTEMCTKLVGFGNATSLCRVPSTGEIFSSHESVIQIGHDRIDAEDI